MRPAGSEAWRERHGGTVSVVALGWALFELMIAMSGWVDAEMVKWFFVPHVPEIFNFLVQGEIPCLDLLYGIDVSLPGHCFLLQSGNLSLQFQDCFECCVQIVAHFFHH